MGGVRVAKQHLRDNEKIPKDERTAKDDDALVSLQLENEMLQRGCEFLPIELGRSYASKYVVEDGKVRLPFTASAVWVMPPPLRWNRPQCTGRSISRWRNCSRPAVWRSLFLTSSAPSALWAVCQKRARWICSV